MSFWWRMLAVLTVVNACVKAGTWDERLCEVLHMVAEMPSDEMLELTGSSWHLWPVLTVNQRWTAVGRPSAPWKQKMAHRSSCKCYHSAANVGCKARWNGSCRQEYSHCCRIPVAMGAWGEENAPVAQEWATSVGSNICLLQSADWSLIQLWLIVHTDAVTALRAISVQHFILGLLKVASFQLLFTSNNHFSLILNGKNCDPCLYAAMVETIRSQCPRLWKSQNWTKTNGKRNSEGMLTRECFQLLCWCPCMRDISEQKGKRIKRSKPGNKDCKGVHRA